MVVIQCLFICSNFRKRHHHQRAAKWSSLLVFILTNLNECHRVPSSPNPRFGSSVASISGDCLIFRNRWLSLETITIIREQCDLRVCQMYTAWLLKVSKTNWLKFVLLVRLYVFNLCLSNYNNIILIYLLRLQATTTSAYIKDSDPWRGLSPAHSYYDATFTYG